MFIDSEAKFNTHVEDLEKRLATIGLPLHEYQALIALRITEFREAILEKIEAGFFLVDVTRVYYTQVVSVLEVAARFAIGKGEKQKRSAILVTFKSTDFSLISIAKDYDDIKIDAPAGVTLLPIAMSAPSNNETVGQATDFSLFGAIEGRRKQYVNNIVQNDEDPINYASCPTMVPSPTITCETSNYTTANPGGGTSADTCGDSKSDDNMDPATDNNDFIDDYDAFALCDCNK